MKICYTNFHRHDGGGHTTYILSLARALAPRHTVWVAAPRTSRLYQQAGEIPGVQRFALAFSSRPIGTLACAMRLHALLRRERFDIVHANGSADHRCVGLAALGLGRRRPRIVFTKHNDMPADGIGNTLRARYATDRALCVSGDTFERLSHTAYRSRGLRLIRNGVDVERFSPWSGEDARQARRRWLGDTVPDNALVVGSNAGVAPHKGWLDMVRAVAGLPAELRGRVFVLLAGQPCGEQERAEIESLFMQDRVVHAGLLHDVRPFIAALDLGFVLSYRIETISFACREMMAMGKPVIVSDAGGLPENIHPGQDGWIVPKRLPACVGAILRDVLDDPARLARMGAAARAKSQAEFRLDRCVADTEAVYREALA